MSKSNVKKLLLIIGIVVGICLISNINYATSTDINELLQNITRIPTTSEEETNTTGTATEAEQNVTTIPLTSDTNNITVIPSDTNTNTNTNTNISKATETTNTNTNSTLPKTGVDDTIFWVLIAVTTVAAGYTYKKVRDYNF